MIKHNLAAIQARAAEAHLRGPCLAQGPTYNYSGRFPISKYLIFGSLFYNGYSTFVVNCGKYPEATKIIWNALHDQHYTVALHECTLADDILQVRIGTAPDPHSLATIKHSKGNVVQYQVNAAGQKNGFYKEWVNGILTVSHKYAADKQYG